MKSNHQKNLKRKGLLWLSVLAGTMVVSIGAYVLSTPETPNQASHSVLQRPASATTPRPHTGSSPENTPEITDVDHQGLIVHNQQGAQAPQATTQSAIGDLVDQLEAALSDSQAWTQISEDLLVLLAQDPTQMITLVKTLASKNNLNLALMVQSTIEGELDLSPELEAEMARFLAEGPSADETAAMYRMLIGFDGVGRALHEQLVNSISVEQDAELINLALLSLKPKSLNTFSYEEKFLAKEALSQHIYDSTAEPTTQYYALASYASWIESEADLDAAERALTQQNINVHSAALANLAQKETERGKNKLIAYAQDPEQPCITRVQALEELDRFSLDANQTQGQKQAKSSACWQAYAEAQKIDDPLLRADALAEIYRPN